MTNKKELNRPNNNDISRRAFLKLSITSLFAGLLNACGIKNSGIEKNKESKTDNTITIEPKENIKNPEVLSTREIAVIVNFARMKQTIYVTKNPDGSEKVVKCDTPYLSTDPNNEPENGEGFQYPSEDFDWSSIEFPEIQIGDKLVPILTSRTDFGDESKNILSQWHKNPNFFRQEIERAGLPKLENPIEKNCLFMLYKCIRNDFWQLNENGCTKVFDDSSTYDPNEMINGFVQSIFKDTSGLVDYKITATSVVSEVDYPLINNAERAPQDLINVYKRTVDYQAISEMAVENGSSIVFVYAGPSAGMFESTIWKEKKSGKEITIFGLNYDCPLVNAMHSWSHLVEDKILNSPYSNLYHKCVGRMEEYSLPYLSDEQDLRNYNATNNGTVYAASGIGSVHLPFNAIAHYQYDSNIPVLLPGFVEPVTSALYGSTEEGYLSWWIQNLPKDFLKALE